MFDLGWSELLIIVVVALVVIGPKDLPVALRAMTKWIGKAKALAREFQDGLNELAKEAELDKVKKDIDEFTRFDPAEEMKKAAGLEPELERSLLPEQEFDENFQPIPRRTITPPTPVAPPPPSAPEISSYAPPPKVEAAQVMGPTPLRANAPPPLDAFEPAAKEQAATAETKKDAPAAVAGRG